LSPLTKVFVVLLVILAMLLSAATIAFVNADDAARVAATTAKDRLAQQLAAAEAARAELEAARQIDRDNLAASQQQLEQARQNNNNLQSQLVNSATQLAQAQSQIAMASADITRLTEGLKAAQTTNAALQQQNDEQRKINDQRLAENTQLNQAVSDLTNRLEVTERERRNLAEQLAEARNRTDQMGAQLRGLGISPEQAAAAGSRVGPQVEGVIREVRPIAGVPYATISVGSNDGVRRGMEFRVVNPQSGDFLGMLTVESVQMNEATGRLAGPKVNQIQSGNAVRNNAGA
jgi:hypothetical protein